jgi:hypothetical protein
MERTLFPSPAAALTQASADTARFRQPEGAAPAHTLFLTPPSFDPEHVQVMLSAFDGACAKLHLRKSDQMTEPVALKIVDLAMAGEGDPDRLIALQDLTH